MGTNELRALNADSQATGTAVPQKTAGRPARTQPEFQHDGITFAGNLELPFDQWQEIPDHPHQRDTIKHAGRSNHLRNFSDTQRKMAMAILPDGRRFKVDGHTRTYMWKNGMVQGLPPAIKIQVDTYHVTDEQALAKLYETFDNRDAVDTVADEVFSASKAAGIVLESPMLASGRYANAIRYIYFLLNPQEPRDQYSLRRATECFAKELVMFDAIKPSNHDFTSGFNMAALFTMARDGDKAADFWRRYQQGKGWKNDDKCDAVQALMHLREYVRLRKQAGGSMNATQFRQCMSAYLAGMADPPRLYTGKKQKPRPAGDDVLRSFANDVCKVRGLPPGYID